MFYVEFSLSERRVLSIDTLIIEHHRKISSYYRVHRKYRGVSNNGKSSIEDWRENMLRTLLCIFLLVTIVNLTSGRPALEFQTNLRSRPYNFDVCRRCEVYIAGKCRRTRNCETPEMVRARKIKLREKTTWEQFLLTYYYNVVFFFFIIIIKFVFIVIMIIIIIINY